MSPQEYFLQVVREWNSEMVIEVAKNHGFDSTEEYLKYIQIHSIAKGDFSTYREVTEFLGETTSDHDVSIILAVNLMLGDWDISREIAEYQNRELTSAEKEIILGIWIDTGDYSEAKVLARNIGRDFNIFELEKMLKAGESSITEVLEIIENLGRELTYDEKLSLVIDGLEGRDKFGINRLKEFIDEELFSLLLEKARITLDIKGDLKAVKLSIEYSDAIRLARRERALKEREQASEQPS